MRSPSPRTTTTAALAAAALLAGCGSSDDEAATTSSAAATSAAAPRAGRLEVGAKDFAFSTATLSAKAGKVTVALQNTGPSEHELVLLKTASAPDALEVTGGRVSEDDSVGEVAEVGAGEAGEHTFDLAPGTYVYVCNIPGHYGDGMRGTLTVK